MSTDYTGHSPESLKAIAKVVQMCLPGWPCNRTTCKRCQQRAAEIQMDPDFENRVWGEISKGARKL